ncbi:MAG: protein kinase domain-containing protein [Chlamydiia bacterium]
MGATPEIQQYGAASRVPAEENGSSISLFERIKAIFSAIFQALFGRFCSKNALPTAPKPISSSNPPISEHKEPFKTLISRFPKPVDQNRDMTSSDKVALNEKFSKLCPGSGGKTIIKDEFTKPNGKKRSLFVVKNEFTKGGEHSVHLCATVSKTNKLKYRALVKPLGFSKKPNSVEIALASDNKKDRLIPKTYFIDKDTDKSIREFAEFGDLTQYAQGATLEQKKSIMSGVLEKYIRLWERGFVHLDAKRANILVHAHGDARITDLSFSKKFKEGDVTEELEFGTPFAMPFGVVDPTTKNWKKVNLLHADFHAVGVLLLETYLGTKYTNQKQRSSSFEDQILFFQKILKENRVELLNKVGDEKLKNLVDNLIYEPEKLTVEKLRNWLSHIKPAKA